MHVQLDRVEIIITYQCNSNCRHCLIQPMMHQGETMDPETARKFVEVLGERYHPYSIMIFGGEPILALPSVLAVLKAATQLKIPQRQLLSNGNWIQREMRFQSTPLSEEERDQIHHIAHNLKLAGLNAVEISIDALHDECLQTEQALYASISLIQEGIESVGISPRWFRSPSEPHLLNQKTLRLLKRAESLNISILPGEAIQPRGNALVHFKKEFTPYVIDGSDRCDKSIKAPNFANIRGICLSPVGDIIICNNIIIGKTTPETILSHLDKYRPEDYPEIKIMGEKGLQGFLDLAKSKKIALPNGPFYSICDACFQYRKALGFKNLCNA